MKNRGMRGSGVGSEMQGSGIGWGFGGGRSVVSRNERGLIGSRSGVVTGGGGGLGGSGVGGSSGGGTVDKNGGSQLRPPKAIHKGTKVKDENLTKLELKTINERMKNGNEILSFLDR